MESFGMSFIKYLLIIFNGIFVLLGIVIIAAASVDISTLRQYSGDGAAGLETDVLLIVVGVLIFIIAALGCFGAVRENTKMLYLFAALLIIIILLELSVGIAAAAMRPQVEAGMKNQLRSTFVMNKLNTGYREFWDQLQMNLECCGVMGPEDYESLNSVIPSASCCPAPDGAGAGAGDERELQRSQCITQKTYYTEGCEARILNSVHGAGVAVIVTGILFCFLEIAGIVLALWLAHAIKNEDKSTADMRRA